MVETKITHDWDDCFDLVLNKGTSPRYWMNHMVRLIG